MHINWVNYELLAPHKLKWIKILTDNRGKVILNIEAKLKESCSYTVELFKDIRDLSIRLSDKGLNNRQK